MIGWSPMARSAQARTMATPITRATQAPCAVLDLQNGRDPRCPWSLTRQSLGRASAVTVRKPAARDLVMLTGAIASRIQGVLAGGGGPAPFSRGWGGLYTLSAWQTARDGDEQTSASGRRGFPAHRPTWEGHNLGATLAPSPRGLCPDDAGPPRRRRPTVLASAGPAQRPLRRRL